MASATGPLAEVFLAGHDADAEQAEGAFGDAGIGRIPERS
jgi:hypothetical protein